MPKLQYNNVDNAPMILKRYQQNLIRRCAEPSQRKIQWVSDLNLCVQPKAGIRYREQQQFAKDQNNIWK